MSMDTTVNEKQVLTKSPIETAKLSPSPSVLVVSTRVPVKIVIISPTEHREKSSKPVITTVFSSNKVSDSLS